MDYRVPWTPQQQYKFTGTLVNPGEPRKQHSFYVLAGNGAPTPTGGWAKINTVDRPKRKGFTNPAGWDPMSMDIPIRFDATVNYGAFGPTAATIERDIQILMWMAGRGKLYASDGQHPAVGTPPLIQVGSYPSGSSKSTNLIPIDLHSDGATDLRWLISNLQFDPNPTRHSGGNRTRQDVTVSLIEYVAAPGAPTSPRQRQQGRGSNSGFRTYVAKAHETIAGVCQQHGLVTVSDWSTVLAFNRKRLKVRSYNTALKQGSKVEIPDRLFTG